MTALSQIVFALICSLFALNASAHPFKLNTELSHPKMVKDQKINTYVKVALTGLELDRDRPPLNIALVIDRSGSMRGQRIFQAKKAAKLAIKMLKPSDIISIVSYNNEAHVLLPATKVGDGSMALKLIDKLHANGGTALYAGTQLGGEEVIKFIEKDNVNRVVLLSDGIANVGPSSPKELAKLGMKLVRKGIAVSTIGLGLGYNEDLMASLADSSDGNHSFVEHAHQLANVMSLELNDASAVVAQDVKIKMVFPKGVRPVRALGREAKFDGQMVTSSIKQLITGTERFVLIEVEVNKDSIESGADLVKVAINYRSNEGQNLETQQVTKAQIAKSRQDMEKSVQASVMESVVELIAREQQAMAIQLKDEGKDDRAAQLMFESNDFLQSNAQRYKSKKLRAMKERAEADQAVMKKRGKGKDWSRTRKAMRKRAYSSKTQMAY